MKQLSSWAAAYVTPLFVLLVMITILMIGASDALAYEAYSEGRTSGFCADCHGGFGASPYSPPSGEADWTDDLHDVHRNDMLDGDCDTCHKGSKFPVLINSSDGGDGLDPISCVGCHGRQADVGNDSESDGLGAGLRQHHTNAGVTDCADCHSDAVPGNYTPVGEDVFPNYYADPATAEQPFIPSDPCNANAEEGAFGGNLFIGLDNDGDGIYDTGDSDCTNTSPVADPNGPYNGTVGVAVSFDGSGSSDSDGTIIAYDWDFGDGNTGVGVSPSHSYAGDGTYTVSLTVTDDAGATDTAGPPPPPSTRSMNRRWPTPMARIAVPRVARCCLTAPAPVIPTAPSLLMTGTSVTAIPALASARPTAMPPTAPIR